MAPPSYARATASSALKASPNSSSKTQDAKTPPSTPKRLKRPSTLTPQHRQSIKYNADLYPIRPLNPSKPCGLVTLPSELRTIIYKYALESDPAVQRCCYISRPQTIRWPKLLHVSQAVRIEAAYVYFTSTAYTFNIRNLNFDGVIKWLHRISPRHRPLLAKNPNLRLNIQPGARPSHTYPPAGWLQDDWLGNHWDACAKYGNLYTLSSQQHQTHFILFCRLMSWFRINASMPFRDITWKYDVAYDWLYDNMSINLSFSNVLCKFLQKEVGVLRMSCVAKTWTRGRTGGGEGKEALNLLGALDEEFERLIDDEKERLRDRWMLDTKQLKETVSKW